MSNAAICSLPLSGRLTVGSGKELVAKDRARAQKFLQGISPHGPRMQNGHQAHTRHEGKVLDATASAAPTTTCSITGSSTGSGDSDSNIDVTNASVSCTVAVGVGSPATMYTLLIDIGSSNTWVGADRKYVPTSTSHSTGRLTAVSYGSGSFSGKEYTDMVTLSQELVIQKQSIGVARTAQGFSGVDGILGVGPTYLTEGTVIGASMVPTVTDNLFVQCTISTKVFSISFEPTAATGAMKGELTFGGMDPSRYTGSLSYVPITCTSPASKYWGITLSLTYGSAGTGGAGTGYPGIGGTATATSGSGNGGTGTGGAGICFGTGGAGTGGAGTGGAATATGGAGTGGAGTGGAGTGGAAPGTGSSATGNAVTDGATQLLSGSSGIVDTGTTLLMIASDAFSAYQQATGATLDSATGLLTITQAQYASLQSLYFIIGSTTFEFKPNAQICPRALNSTLGGSADKIYLVVSSTGRASGFGLDFIYGLTFLQRFYSVFDTANTQVALATTCYTDATTN